jgi:hypothetical protein
LRGGSGAVIQLDQDSVRKVATRAGLTKLRSEGRWLDWAGSHGDAEIRSRFPTVLTLPSDSDPALVLRRLPGVGARAAILSGREPEVRSLVSAAVRFAFGPLARLAAPRPGGIGPGRWCAAHLSHSLHTAMARRNGFQALFRARRLNLPDAVLPNPLYDGGTPVLRTIAEQRTAHLRVIHGDLHLGNMLIDPDAGEFYLVDPRGDWNGERHFDAAYDVAKLLHEPHYVLARSGLVRLRLQSVRNVLRIEPTDAVHAMPEALRALAQTSRRLAVDACQTLLREDPMLPARATVLTGVLLLSVLRLSDVTADQCEALMAYGLCWLISGLQAIAHDFGLGRCQQLWDALMAEPLPDGLSGITFARWLEVD